jgi:hypothetical protein
MPLKEQCQEIFEIFSFHDSSSPGLPLIPSAPFRFFLSKIGENIRKSRFTANVVGRRPELSNCVVDTGGKCATGANDAGKFAACVKEAVNTVDCRRSQRLQWSKMNTISGCLHLKLNR